MTTHFSIKICMVGLATLAAGCTGLPDWSLFGPLQTNPEAATAASYDFSWRLSGDKRAGPLQVFDDGSHTWLQFAPNQATPAIFARSEQGDQLLTYRLQGPYVVLEGVWPLLILRAAGLESRVQREVADQAAVPEPLIPQEASVVTDPVESESLLSQSAAVLSVVPPPAEEVALAFPLDAVPTATLASTQRYRVSPDDGTMRSALSRWARSAGWTFEAEHWAVDVDIPIVGSAVFELEFDEAVQELLAATELSERPLQPCFYANKVLRVVSYAQSCDRSAPLEQA